MDIFLFYGRMDNHSVKCHMNHVFENLFKDKKNQEGKMSCANFAKKSFFIIYIHFSTYHSNMVDTYIFFGLIEKSQI